MKKIGLIVIIIMLLSTSIFAAGESKSASTQLFSLDDCLKLGFQNNNQILVADSTIKMYEYETKRAFSVFLPNLSYNVADYETYKYKTANGTTDNNYVAKGLTLSQMLFDGGSNYANYSNAQIKLTTALEDKRRTEQSLTYQIKAAFYDMWLKQQNLITAKASENDMEKHYKLVYRMYKAGTKNKLELYEAQGQWEEQKVASATAKNELEQSRLTLANLMNTDRFLAFEVKYDLSQFEPKDINNNSTRTLIKEAYRDRSEMHKASLVVKIAENNLKIQKVKILPTLSLAYDYEVDSKKVSDNDGTKKWYMVCNLSGILFDGLNYQAGVASAKQNLESTRLQENIQRDQIAFEVTQSLQSLKQSRDLIKSTRLNVSFMKERVSLINLQYKNGKADTTDFISAQTALDKALNRYYAQIINYLTALVKLDYVMGRDTLLH